MSFNPSVIEMAFAGTVCDQVSDDAMRSPTERHEIYLLLPESFKERRDPDKTNVVVPLHYVLFVVCILAGRMRESVLEGCSGISIGHCPCST